MKNNCLKKRVLAFLTAVTMGIVTVPFGACASTDHEADISAEQAAMTFAKTHVIPSGAEMLERKDYVPCRVNVFLKSGNFQVGKPLPGLEGITVDFAVELNDRTILACVSGEGMTTAEMLDRLNGDPRVIFAEPDYVIRKEALTDDPLLGLQWTMENTRQNGFSSSYDINPELLFATPASGEEVVIVSLDEGVDYTHEDLQNKMWVNSLEIPGNGIDDDGNGYVDDIHGINPTAGRMDGDPMPNPEMTHGTHTVGTMLAEANNAIGMAGVAGNSDNVKVLAINMADEGGLLSTGAAIRGYDYIHKLMTRSESPVNIVAVNNSWGCDDTYPYALEAMIDLVGQDGAVSVIACGNEYVDMNAGIKMDRFCDYLGHWLDEQKSPAWDYYYGMEYSYQMSNFPAITESKYAIRVSAMTGDGVMADFSNCGYDFADIAAPGGNILSTVSEYVFEASTYTSAEVAERTAAFISKDFAFRKNSEDPFDNNDQITIRNNVQNNTYFSNNSVKDQVSVNIEIKDAQAQYPYLVELPYEAVGLVNEQEPYVTFTAMLLECPEGLNEEKGFLCLYTEGPASEPVKTRGQVVDMGNDDEAHDLRSTGLYTSVWKTEHRQMTIKPGTDRILRLYLYPTINGNYTITFDNFALSRGKADEEETFGKYEYMSGTSMATPTVTGALALLVSRDPSLDTAMKRKNAVLNHTRQLASLDGKVRRSLVLDLNASCDHEQIPLIKSVEYEDGKITIKGEALSRTTLTVDGNSVAAAEATDTMITAAFTAENMKTYAVRLESSKGYSTGSFMGVKGTNYTTSQGDDGSFPIMPDYNFTTDGKYLYILDAVEPEILVYEPSDSDPDHMEQVRTISYDFDNFLDGHYGGDSLSMLDLGYNSRNDLDSFQYYDGSFFFTVSAKDALEYDIDGYPLADDLYKVPVKSELIRVDAETGSVTIYQLPENLYAPTVGIYDGKIVLAGGFDLTTNTLTDTTYVGDGEQWTMAARLPEKRAYGKLTAAADKLYFTGGTNEKSTGGEGTTPEMLIWNGSSWTKSGLQLRYPQYVTTAFDRVNYPRYEMGVSPIKGGLLFTDRVFTNAQDKPLGDTLKYDAAAGTLTDYGYYYHRMLHDHVRGMVVGDHYRGYSLREDRKNLEKTASIDGEDMDGIRVTSVMNGYDETFPMNEADVLASPNGPGSMKIVLTATDGNVANMPFRVKSSGVTINRFSQVCYTNAEGVIELTGLMPGEYSVTEIQGAVNEKYTLPEEKEARLPFDSSITVELQNILTVPPVPETGDGAMPFVWMLLFTASASCLLILNRKQVSKKKN